MAEIETELEGVSPSPPTPAPTQISTADLLIGVTGVVDAEDLRSRVSVIEAALGAQPVTGRILLACPSHDARTTPIRGPFDLVEYPLPAGDGLATPWALITSAQLALLSLAAETQAPTVVLLHPDLQVFEGDNFRRLLEPVLSKRAELSMGSYTQGPFDSLISHSILAPLNRALYGRHVRFPLSADLALSARLGARLGMSSHATVPSVLWPATVAASMDAAVADVHLTFQHARAGSDLDLSTVLTQLAGAAFTEVEHRAPLWQRMRPSPPVNGAPVAGGSRFPVEAVDPSSMIQSFQLGSRSLQDVWGLVLPPVTLLELKRLTLLPPEKFRMPDELWARIVYDFALAYRLRTINRTHLLGALTPLYLGWVGSYVTEAGTEPVFDPVARIEKLARAFEDGKPYLVRRWRWPDRFNP